MIGMPEIVPLAPSHANQIESFVEESDRSRVGQIVTALPSGNLFSFAAVNGAAIGWIVVHTIFDATLGWIPDQDTVKFQSGENAYLEHLHIRSDSRRAGTGSALLTCAEQHASKLGKKRLWLHVSPTNQSAQGFYQHHGWEREYVAHPEWRDYKPMEVWSKNV